MVSAGTQVQLPLWAIVAAAIGVLALTQVIVVKKIVFYCCILLASFPGLPHFCSLVYVQYNTWKRKSGGGHRGEGLTFK